MPIEENWETGEIVPAEWLNAVGAFVNAGASSDVAAATHAAASKATPADADTFPMVDTEALNVLKKWSFAQMKTALASWLANLTATWTNKTITLGSNTITGTLAQFNTACTDADFASLLGAEVLEQKALKNYKETVVAGGTVTTSYTPNLANGNVFDITLTASTVCAVTMPTAAQGASFRMRVKQAASVGAGTITFGSTKWDYSGTPVQTSVAGSMDIWYFESDGTNWYGSVAQGFTP